MARLISVLAVVSGFYLIFRRKEVAGRILPESGSREGLLVGAVGVTFCVVAILLLTGAVGVRGEGP